MALRALEIETPNDSHPNPEIIRTLGKIAAETPSASRTLSRRAFLGQSMAVTGAALASFTTGGAALLHNSERQPIPQTPGILVARGWIGAEATQLMHNNRGPIPFFLKIGTGNPIIRTIAANLFTEDFVPRYKAKQRYNSIAEVAQDGYKQTDKLFLDLLRDSPGSVQAGVDLEGEKAHAAWMALAIATSGWPSRRQYRLLDVGEDIIPGGKDAFYMGENSLGRTVLPKVKPLAGMSDPPDGLPNLDGGDGARHFFAAGAIHLTLLRSMDQDLKLEETLPDLVKFTTRLINYRYGLPPTNEVKSSVSTQLLALFYELSKSIEPKNIPILTGKGPKEIDAGLFDYLVSKDLENNAQGIAAAEMLNQTKTPEARMKVFDKLRHPHLLQMPVAPVLKVGRLALISNTWQT